MPIKTKATVKKPRAKKVAEEPAEIMPVEELVDSEMAEKDEESMDPVAELQGRVDALTHDLEEANKALETEKAKYAVLEKRYGRVIRLYNLVTENYIQED